MKVPQPDDTLLKQQQQAASISSVNALQGTLGTVQDSALRYFGARRALSGAKSSPLMR
jgi:hypothetical protein